MINASGFSDVVFSEVMADPEPSVALPEVEYLEIYNRTNQNISLNGWMLFSGDKSYPLPVCNISANGYLILCPKSGSAEFSKDINMAIMNTFPVLPNNGKTIYLVDSKNTLMACLEYDYSWYGSGFKSQGGWSLECMDTENLSGEKQNWTSSKDVSGGTPGKVNSVKSSNPDTIIPLLERLYVPDSGTLELNFSKMMDIELLNDENSFFFEDACNIVVKSEPKFPAYRSVYLKLSDLIIPGKIYELKIRDIKDISGNFLADTSIFFSLPMPPDSFCLSINEIMFNPTPAGCDYIEFVNSSDKCIDLSEVWISNRNEQGELNEGCRLSEKPLPCFPGSYWLLSVNADTVFNQSNISPSPNHIDISKMPSLPDDMGNIVLLSTNSKIIDEATYDDKMHFMLINYPEGVSLEKINPKLSSLSTDSWMSASSVSGYGTPGYVNSQFREICYVPKDDFVFTDNAWLSPDNDGINDFVTITVIPPEPGIAGITIYDIKGREIRKVASNCFVGSDERFFWDGKDENGNLVKFGKYVVFASYFSPNGKSLKKRFVLSVLMKE